MDSKKIAVTTHNWMEKLSVKVQDLPITIIIHVKIRKYHHLARTDHHFYFNDVFLVHTTGINGIHKVIEYKYRTYEKYTYWNHHVDQYVTWKKPLIVGIKINTIIL